MIMSKNIKTAFKRVELIQPSFVMIFFTFACREEVVSVFISNFSILAP